MLAIAIRSQVINFSFFGQSSTTRDTLVNGVFTSTSERWSDSQDSTRWETVAASNNICLKVFSCRFLQGTAYINFHAAMLPPVQVGNSAGSIASGTNLIHAWVNRCHITTRLTSF